MNQPKRFFTTCFLAIFLLLNPLSGKSQCNPLTTPYLQTFQSISANNQLPACWASSPAQSCLTYSTTNSYGAFYNASNVAYFFSPAFQMLSANPYFISLKYQADALAAGTFTNISIYRNTSQSTVGMTLVNSFTPIVNSNYASWSVSNTIPADGNYYYIIEASAAQTTVPAYLNWDDFQINALCLANPIPTVAASNNICPGYCHTLSIMLNPPSGPVSYSWSNGANTNSTIVCPTIATTYTGVVTNTITSCVIASVTPTVTVLNPMSVIVAASNTTVCLGQPVTLSAFGAGTYSWSTNQTGPVITVTPQTNTTYSVVGSTAICSNTASVTINTVPLPTVIISPASPTLCQGESIVLTASGATSYTWIAGPNTSTMNITAGTITQYLVTGMNANLCSDNEMVTLVIEQCTGIEQAERISPIKILSDRKILLIHLEEKESADLKILGIDGRIIYEGRIQGDKNEIDLEQINEQVLVVQLNTGDKIYRKKIFIE